MSRRFPRLAARTSASESHPLPSLGIDTTSMVDLAMNTIPARRVHSGCLFGTITTAFCLASLPSPAAADRTGEEIYKQDCLSCHGKQGEGSKDYGHPLVGDRSVDQLAKFIAKTMPEDDPGTCVGEDAEKVAAYIYDAFYSKTAQARNKPPRIELSRLTVRQYRNAVADLIGSFRAPGQWDDPSGLHGEYFKTQRFRQARSDRIIDRVDPTVQFDFGVNLPGRPEDRSATSSPIRWEGSVLAPETGDYEFIVRTEHAHAALGQRRQEAADRRLGEVGQRHRVPRVDPPAGRPRLSDPARVLQGQAGRGGPKQERPRPAAGEGDRSRCSWKAPAAGRRGDPAAEPVAGQGARRRSSSRRRSRRTTAASATSGARRSRRPGTRRRPTRRSRSPATSSAHLSELAGAERRRQGPRGEAARVLPQVRRAGVPPAAHRRAEEAFYVDRQFEDGEGPGDGRQAGRAAGPQVAAVPLPRDRRRRSTRTTSPPGSRSGSGIRCPTRRCSTPRRPASWPPASRWPRRPSGWSTDLRTRGRSSASSCSSG